MEKLIEIIFSNIFIVIIVITGISKLFKKVNDNDNTPDSDGKTNNPRKESGKKFNIFDFDFEKWIEEQAGQQKNNQKGLSTKHQPSSQIKVKPNNSPELGSFKLQSSNSYEGSQFNTASHFINNSSAPIEDETRRSFDIDTTDMQKAIVMAEILGPPRAKRKSIRY
ncbi:MAG: hypothetical protein K0R71_171 [Bacillales bacterium]|jgi:hypothetical protein|nr:hypothetical protein [Bacillales bacterium]